ncbi:MULTISPECIES: NUDIX domain-containing protein [Bacillus]|uniref:NUDIX domain-containing protein n=1 Tax=Bacillus TaxID=1386 RepID=UPI00138ADE5A|nr:MULTISPECIES: NUDIX domain-containing protein [Bacillus]MBD3861251.1 NUDIX domain-containing protein [Bacillus sp. 28A-2]MCW1837941.1 NUDIX domain-containing protein [Bacillus xiamenensis]
MSKVPPFGAAIIIYKLEKNIPYFLILHRKHKGIDYEGRWAWGPPAGARFPGEEIEVCMKRELFEETGLQVDCKELIIAEKSWSLYYGEVDNDVTISLSEEHDRFLWVDFDEAISRCSPEIVKDQIRYIYKLISVR